MTGYGTTIDVYGYTMTDAIDASGMLEIQDGSGHTYLVSWQCAVSSILHAAGWCARCARDACECWCHGRYHEPSALEEIRRRLTAIVGGGTT